DARLGGAVIRLTGIAVQAGGGRDRDDPRIGHVTRLRSLAPVRGGPARGTERALEVNANHRVPFVLAHVHEHAVADDSRVRDQAVESTEGLERTRHEASGTVPVRDVLGVSYRSAPEPANLLDDGVGRRGRVSGSVDLAAAI